MDRPRAPHVETSLVSLIDSVSRAASEVKRAVEDVDEAGVSALISNAIVEHVAYMRNWSKRDQIFGMSTGRPIHPSTVPLLYSDRPRRFRGIGDPGEPRTEEWILDHTEHTLVLGDPGAGKTTTVKRFCRALLKRLDASQPDGDTSLPILIVVRETDPSFNLEEKLLGILGITRTYDPSMRPQINEQQLMLESDEDYERRQKLEQTAMATWLQRERLEDESRLAALRKALDATNATILIDGLDELPDEYQGPAFDRLIGLAQRLTFSRLVASCRSGAYVRTVHGFDAIEILPLDQTQTNIVVASLVRDPNGFWKEVRRCNFQDLVQRPLMLTQLSMIYENSGSLPDRPATVYRMMVELFLRAWDSDRQLRRVSRYAHFDVEDKQDFLSALAHYLTSRIRGTRFSEDDLLAAFVAIHDRFQLPLQDAQLVVDEIESHTGLLVNSGYNHFEFSHRVLQEYLCAYYLVRDPSRLLLPEYLANDPEPVGLAIALSSNPTSVLAGIALGETSLLSTESIGKLLARLSLERPWLDNSMVLGASALRLLESHSTAIDMAFAQYFSLPNAVSSVAKALTLYEAVATDDGGVDLKSIDQEALDLGAFRLPEKISLSRSALAVVREQGLELVVNTSAADRSRMARADDLKY